MGEIVNKYESYSDMQYLLPIITRCTDERIQYRNAISRVNIALKEIARLVGLAHPLSMYCARHAWASIAKSKISLLQSLVKVWGTIQKKRHASILLRLTRMWWIRRTDLF